MQVKTQCVYIRLKMWISVIHHQISNKNINPSPSLIIIVSFLCGSLLIGWKYIMWLDLWKTAYAQFFFFIPSRERGFNWPKTQKRHWIYFLEVSRVFSQIRSHICIISARVYNFTLLDGFAPTIPLLSNQFIKNFADRYFLSFEKQLTV